jgi:Tfp pilus assembly protein PilN
MTEQLTDERVSETLPVEAGPVRIAWASVPRVNLLPIEIIDARRFRRTKIMMAATVLGAVVVASAGVLWAQAGVNAANDDLAASESRVTSLQNEQTRYAAVPQVAAQLDAANNARTQAMGTDVLWYRYLNDVRDAQPTNVKLDSLTLTLTATSASAVAGPSADVLSTPGIGTIQTAGTAAQYSQVSAWLEALNKLGGTSSSRLSTASKATDVDDPTKAVTFAVGAVITSDALSHRYDKKAG